MEKTLVQRLRPYISVFSVEMDSKNKDGDSVRVGGTVKGIIDLSDYDIKVGDSDIETYVTIDDSIGETTLLFIKDSYKIYNEKFNFENGMVILAEGSVLKNAKRPLSERRIEKSSSVLCWKIQPIEKVEETV